MKGMRGSSLALRVPACVSLLLCLCVVVFMEMSFPLSVGVAFILWPGCVRGRSRAFVLEEPQRWEGGFAARPSGVEGLALTQHRRRDGTAQIAVEAEAPRSAEVEVAVVVVRHCGSPQKRVGAAPRQAGHPASRQPCGPQGRADRHETDWPVTAAFRARHRSIA